MKSTSLFIYSEIELKIIQQISNKIYENEQFKNLLT